MPSESFESSSAPGNTSRLCLYEDADLLVVNKPAGMNTHSPAPYAGEGIYDWLRHREPRWADLAIIHRLDKETSGVLVFGKTPAANRSLTDQFTQRTIRKTYVLLTDRSAPSGPLQSVSTIARAGETYVSRPLTGNAPAAETHFRPRGTDLGFFCIEATPLTGRTHQIRVHAAEAGFPVLGDTLYGGTAWTKVCLHAEALVLRHPTLGRVMTFSAPVDFGRDPRLALREAIIDAAETNAFRLVHGSADGYPGWQVDRLDQFLLSQWETELSPSQRAWLEGAMGRGGAYHKLLQRRVRQTSITDVSPRHVGGQNAPPRFVVRENQLVFELSLQEGYSTGLFLDQRENRRRILKNHVAGGFPLFPTGGSSPALLNAFAYTCGFSVCAAAAGARTTSLDLSAKYLEWGKRNFALNGLAPEQHEFLHGDVFDWLRRLAKKQRTFDVVLLDPPTFSQSKQSGIFRAERDYGSLAGSALKVLRPQGVLFASTNAASLAPERFVAELETAVEKAGRRILQRHFVPQPPDFPISRAEPGYLKTIWLRIS